jgi:hypothetical protein
MFPITPSNSTPTASFQPKRVNEPQSNHIPYAVAPSDCIIQPHEPVCY